IAVGDCAPVINVLDADFDVAGLLNRRSNDLIDDPIVKIGFVKRDEAADRQHRHRYGINSMTIQGCVKHPHLGRQRNAYVIQSNLESRWRLCCGIVVGKWIDDEIRLWICGEFLYAARSAQPNTEGTR